MGPGGTFSKGSVPISQNSTTKYFGDWRHSGCSSQVVDPFFLVSSNSAGFSRSPARRIGLLHHLRASQSRSRCPIAERPRNATSRRVYPGTRIAATRSFWRGLSGVVTILPIVPGRETFWDGVRVHKRLWHLAQIGTSAKCRMSRPQSPRESRWEVDAISPHIRCADFQILLTQNLQMGIFSFRKVLRSKLLKKSKNSEQRPLDF